MYIFTYVPTNYERNMKYFPSSLSQKLEPKKRKRNSKRGKSEREKREAKLNLNKINFKKKKRKDMIIFQYGATESRFTATKHMRATTNYRRK